MPTIADVSLQLRVLAGSLLILFLGFAPVAASDGSTGIAGTCWLHPGPGAEGVNVEVFPYSAGDEHLVAALAAGKRIPLPGIDLDPRGSTGSGVERSPVYVVDTDSSGYWVVAGLPPGRYLVLAQRVADAGRTFAAAAEVSTVTLGTFVNSSLHLVANALLEKAPPIRPPLRTVYFATYRQPGPIDGAGSPLATQTYENAASTTAAFGRCNVELSAGRRFFCTQSSQAEVMHEVWTAVGASESKELTIFVHGYNESFEKVIQATAALSAGIDRPVLAFDWPSFDSETNYEGDRENVDALDATMTGQPEKSKIAQFFAAVSRSAKPYRIAIIAHSMGARVASLGLIKLPQLISASDDHFVALTFAAADLPVDTFNVAVENLLPSVRRIDEYTSARDNALYLSQQQGDHAPRAGQGCALNMTLRNFTCIDATAAQVGTGWDLVFHHGYIYKDSTLLEDVRLFFDGSTPAERIEKKLLAQDGSYYRFVGP
jgi:pimeloyl-ACP methyl ester carboxylesterase